MTALLIALLSCGTLAWLPAVEARREDGRVVQGELASLSPAEVQIRLPVELVRLNIGDLESLRWTQEAASPRAAVGVIVELVDRSTLAAAQFRAASSRATIVLPGGEAIELPASLIRSVRLREPAQVDATSDAQWNEIMTAPAEGDVIVVRKAKSLDYLSGKIGDVDDESVSFIVNGETTLVKRTKVEGWSYFHPAREFAAERVCEARLVGDSRLQLTAASLDGGALRLETVCGATLFVPMSAVESLNFAVARMQYLSDLEPDELRVAPRLEPAEPLASLTALLRPRKDAARDGRPLLIEGRECRGWSLASRTELEFRLPGAFRRLQMVVAMDELTIPLGGQVFARIQADGKTLWERTIRAADPPEKLDLEIAGARRLRILVDYADLRDAGDWLNLCDAKVVK